MGSAAGRWHEELGALAAAARVIAVDRRGYGRTPAPDGYTGTTVAEQAEDLAATLDALATGPAVLAGEDVGALACLDVLLRRPERVRAAVLLTPLLYSLVPAATDALTAERIALGERIHDDGPRAAMEAWLGHPSDADPAAFFADWSSVASLPVSRRQLRAVSAPVVVLAGERAEPHVRGAATELAGALPGGRLVEGADVAAAVLELLPAG